MKPMYLNTRIRNETERANRDAAMFKDAGLLFLLVLGVIVAVWLCH